MYQATAVQNGKTILNRIYYPNLGLTIEQAAKNFELYIVNEEMNGERGTVTMTVRDVSRQFTPPLQPGPLDLSGYADCYNAPAL